MTALYTLIQDQLTVIGTILVIVLTVLLCLELSTHFQSRWEKPEPLEGKIVHRYYQPAQKTLTLVDNFYGYVPVPTLENERFILDVEANGQRYQVETSETEYRALSIGDRITIYPHPDDII